MGRSAVALGLFLSVATALLVVAAARVVGVRNPVLLGGVGLLAVLTGLTGIGTESATRRIRSSR
jgi:high-affinity Fe2+/Pb2+ permease